MRISGLGLIKSGGDLKSGKPFKSLEIFNVQRDLWKRPGGREFICL